MFSPKHRFLIFVFIALFLSFIFFFHNLKSNPNLNLVERVFFSAGAYAQSAINLIISLPTKAWSRYVFLINTEKENQRLLQEIQKLRQENILLQEAALANQRLRALLEFKKQSPFKLIAAEVIGVDPSLYFESFLINKGKKEGIKRGMAVLGLDGVIGKILKESDSFSVVLLLIDPGFALDAIIQRTRTQGIVEGIGNGLCRMKYILGSEDVRIGDLVISSGLEGFFPKGIPIGKVIFIKKDGGSAFQELIIQPVVNLKKTEEVLVVLDLNKS